MFSCLVSFCLCLAVLAESALPCADGDATCERVGQQAFQLETKMQAATMEVREQGFKSVEDVRPLARAELAAERQKMNEEVSRAPDPPFNVTSLQWALAIDGKDADRGEHAYGQHFDRVLDVALPWVLQSSRGAACEKVSMDFIDHIQQRCCPGWKLRWFTPMLNYGPSCFRNMGCKAVQAAIEDIPPELMVVHVPYNSSNGRCEQVVVTRQKNAKAIKQELERIIERYNEKLASIHADEALGKAALQDAKLEALAKFLRSYAWLHPWQNGNGRTRTLLLQHQLRCLGLAPGAFMYNNNRDIFFIDKATYVRKIREGISIAGVAMQKPWRRNPWVDHDRVKKHLKEFPPPANGKCFSCHCSWGSVE